jgi:HAD superfamily hydrolase (TIGR01509 family)
VKVPTLIFDCDGVLADTERFGHLPAFNQTFDEFSLPVHWTDEEYAHKLLIGGGKERMRSLLTPEFIRTVGLPEDEPGQVDVVTAWHRRKTEIYTQMVAAGTLPARPGIKRIVQEALAEGMGLAVASTSAELSVRAVLEHAVGADAAAQFTVFAGDIVPAKKPAPDIYLLALHDLGLDANEALVIEDSANGLRASTAAGIRTVVTVSSYTREENFDSAALVVTSLGDPSDSDPDGTPDADAEPTIVLAAPAGVRPRDYVRITDMLEILHTPGPAPRP